jgi:cobalt-zinc-cadmium resistance protein CzcA
MLNQLIEKVLHQRLMVAVLVIGIMGLGFAAMLDLPIDAFPDVSSTQVKIIMKSPGLTPEEVEARITAPIELEMLGIPKQTMLRSVAKYGLTDITIDFADGTDIYWARQQVIERLQNAQDNLPSDISGGIAPMTTPLGEMVMFTIENPALSLAEKRSLLDWVIRPQLRTVNGVADVNALGGLVRSFEIRPDLGRMTARGISMQRLQQALDLNNRNDGAGRINEGEEALIVRAEGRLQNETDILNTVISSQGGTPIRVADVAEVSVGALTRYGAVSQNGQGEAVEGLVLGLRGANANALVQGVKTRLAELQATLPKGTRIQVFYDRSNLVQRAVHTVSKALMEAIVLVIILLILFLGDMRAAISVALVLPMAALCTFWLMRQFDLSANLMSLGGLSIAIGMLVDAAVVVVENVAARLSMQTASSSKAKLQLIMQATQEVSVPVASGILIIITVFLPLLTLQGLEGKLFAPVALTIVFALASSLLLSLLVVPVICSWMLKQMPHSEPWLVRKAQALYSPILAWALNHQRKVIIGALLAVVLSALLYTQIGKIFMPTMDEGDIIVGTEKLPSINLQQSLAIDQRLQKNLLQKIPEIRQIVSRVGTDEIGLDPMGLNQTDNFLILKPAEQWRFNDKNLLIDDIRKVMGEMPGVAYTFTQPIDMRVNEMILGVRGDVAIKVFGPDLNQLTQLAQQIKAILKTIHGNEDVFTPQNSGVQYLSVQIDRVAAGRLGFSVAEIEDILRAHIEGKQLGIVLESQRRTPIIVRGDNSIRDSSTAFSALRLTTANGVSVPISAVANLVRIDGPVKIDRERGSRMAVVTVNVRGRDLLGFVDEAKQKMATQLHLAEGYHLQWGGQFENQQRAAARLALVIPIALALIFLILYSTFNSIRQTLLILCNIPFALIGGVLALWLSGEYLSVPASVGFIALLGIAVLNGVVMVSYFNQLRQQAMSLRQVVIEGAKRRLRPVLMTASIAAFGLMPLLFVTGPGAEIQRPLAIVVIGGLFSSTLLTLLILPMLYERFAVSPDEMDQNKTL